LDVYKHCRRAVYEKGENDWVVPEGFGQRDFLRVVGHQFVSQGSGALDGLNKTLDVPGETCIDLREWEELDAAPRTRWVSSAVAGAVIIVSLFTLV
jgi:hypothetical protein